MIRIRLNVYSNYFTREYLNINYLIKNQTKVFEKQKVIHP
jgi:hypothetical protein